MVLLSSLLKFFPPLALPLPDSLSILPSSSPCLDNLSCLVFYPQTFFLAFLFSHSICSRRMVPKPVSSSETFLKCQTHILYCQLETSSWIFFRQFKLNTSSFLPIPPHLSWLMALPSSQANSSGSSFSSYCFSLPTPVLVSCSFYFLKYFSSFQFLLLCLDPDPLYSSG